GTDWVGGRAAAPGRPAAVVSRHWGCREGGWHATSSTADRSVLDAWECRSTVACDVQVLGQWGAGQICDRPHSRAVLPPGNAHGIGRHEPHEKARNRGRVQLPAPWSRPLLQPSANRPGIYRG